MFAPEKTTDTGEIIADDVMERLIAERGDIFPEFHFMARERPKTVHCIRRSIGYVHQYDNHATPDQELSCQMRELIALCQLSSQGDDRFAANHVRRLYRMGVTNAVMLEASEAYAAVFGNSTIPHVAQAILTANSAEYTYGVLPPGGEPKSLLPFPELAMGRVKTHSAKDGLQDIPEWQYIATIDPELARRAAEFVDHCLLPDGAKDELLGPGPRELLAIAALCVRGEVDIAAQHIRRAYAYGMNRHQVLEAISCVLPMTGAISLQIGARALQAAD